MNRINSLAQGRYVRKDTRIYPDSHCLYCGSNYGICQGEPRACKTTTCKACGTKQCMVNGLGRGQCGICYIGLLPGWSGTDKQCGYKGCTNQAVAAVGGQVKFSCVEHLARNGKADYIKSRIEARDKEFELKPDYIVPILGE